MNAEQSHDEEYVLGHSDHELARLSAQAQRYEPFTRQFLHNAGISDGMRVLDVGCGRGDVTFLAAQFVGPTGQVVGIDTSPIAITTAQQRAHDLSLTNTHFVVGDMGTLATDTPYDAVIGRFVLQFLPDPSAILRKVATTVRPGGVIAFQEIDNSGCHTFPTLPTLSQSMQWIIQGMERSGADPFSGLHLWANYEAAGLPAPTLSLHASVGAGPDYALYTSLAELIRSLLPTLESFGIATASEVDIDTLAQRIRQEALDQHATIVGQNLISAVVQMPATSATDGASTL